MEEFDINQIQDPDIELVRAWIGPKNQELYLKKYYKGDLGFNLLAFLLPDIVFLTRKMWIESFIILVLDVILLFINGGIPYPVAILIRLILGFAYYPLYSASIRRKIKKNKLQGLSYEQQLDKARKTGGDKITASVIVAILLVGIVLILLFIRLFNLAYSNMQKLKERDSELLKKLDYEAKYGTNLETLEKYTGKAINTNQYGKLVNYVSKYESKSNKKIKWRLFYQGENKTFLIMDKLTAKPITPGQIYDKKGETRYTDGSTVGEVGKKLNPMLFEQKPEFFTKSNESENIRYLAWMTDTENELWTQFKDEDGIAEYAIGGPSIELFAQSFNRTAATRSTSNTLKIKIETNGYRCENYSAILSSSYNNGIYFKNELVWIASPGFTLLKADEGFMGTCLSKDFRMPANSNVYTDEAFLRPIVCISTDDFNKNYDFIEE